MQNNGNAPKTEYIKLGLIGCLLGILCFVSIFGVKILNFTYDSWLMNSDLDLSQHYVGWCHFRSSDFSFPIGLIDSLSVPNSMSVVYTDSIPLFAFIFKIIRGILPVHFQYFGMYGLLCYALQGGLSAVLLRKFTDKKFICIVGSLFFILSFPLLQRMFYHTALASQWLIILSFILWFIYDLKVSNKRNILVFGMLGFLCVGIHSYYVFMCGIILLLSVIDNIITSIKLSIPKKDYLLNSFIPIISFCVFAFINLYILGGFYGKSSVSGAGFGVFNANLNALYNPYYYGRILPVMSLYDDFQYEGSSYLGLGMLILATIITMLGIYLYVKNDKREKLISYLKNHHRKTIIIIGIIFSFLFSVFPNFDFGNKKIVHVPLPGLLIKIFGIFRTNGRFMWIAMYLIILSVLIIFSKYANGNVYKIILSVVVLIQLFDISAFAKSKGNYFKENQEYESVWTQFETMNVFDNKREFTFMYNDSDIMMDTGLYGYLNNMTQNSFYYARPIDDAIFDNIIENENEIKAGRINPEKIYIFKQDGINEDIRIALLNAGAIEYYFDNHLFYVKK